MGKPCLYLFKVMFSSKYRYVFILLLGVYSWSNTLFTKVYDYYSIEIEQFWILLAFLLFSYTIWEGNRLLERVFLKREFRLSKRRIHPLVIVFLLSLPFTGVSVFAISFLIGKLILSLPPAEFSLPLILALTFGFRINLFLHSINTIFFFLDRYREKQVEAEKLKKVGIQLELQNLKDQLNPHFLFNNLNVLSALLIKKNSKDANDFLEKFSQVYRYILHHKDNNLVRLEKELQFLDAYLFLIQHRFPNAVIVENLIPEELEKSQIVPVSLQILVENAVKHNSFSAKQPLHIRIAKGEHNYLEVTNTLSKKEVNPSDSNGIGLKLVKDRFLLATQSKVIVTSSDQFFHVFLPLIFHKNEAINH